MTQEREVRALFVGWGEPGDDLAQLLEEFKTEHINREICIVSGVVQDEAKKFIQESEGCDVVIWGARIGVCVSLAVLLLLVGTNDSRAIIDITKIRVDENDFGDQNNISNRYNSLITSLSMRRKIYGDWKDFEREGRLLIINMD